MSGFVGRDYEQGLLQQQYKASGSNLVVVYGRRRVGKSTLLDHFLSNKNNVLRYEALEGLSQQAQITQFKRQLLLSSKDPMLKNMEFQSWNDVFDYLTQGFLKGSQKKVLFIDEFQWLAGGRSNLVSLIKYYWDNHWSKQNVMIILCGSVASFMVGKLIKSKALYGRISLEIHLQGLSPREVKQFFRGKRSEDEILRYILTFGGIPKYLEELNLSRSYKQNIEKLCFTRNGFFVDEATKIFYNQFREPKTYIEIVQALRKTSLSFKEISEHLGISSGGGLKSYLDNLELAGIITGYIPFGLNAKSKFKKYRIVDEYMAFYHKFIEPHAKLINNSKLSFSQIEKSLEIWFGFAFERFIQKHAIAVAHEMGFGDEVLDWGSWHQKHTAENCQIDLVFKRSDKVIVLCEVKYLNEKVGFEIIADIERKKKLLKIPRGYTLETALITVNGVEQRLAAQDYFTYILDIANILAL